MLIKKNLLFHFESNFKVHKAECPSRANFDRYMFSVSNNTGSEPAPSVQESRSQPRPRRPIRQDDDDEEESWDHVSYLVLAYFVVYNRIHSMTVLMIPFVLSTFVSVQYSNVRSSAICNQCKCSASTNGYDTVATSPVRRC